MLVLGRETGQFLYIKLADHIDPDMTVRDLFSDGPIIIGLSEVRSEYEAAIGIEASSAFKIIREELA